MIEGDERNAPVPAQDGAAVGSRVGWVPAPHVRATDGNGDSNGAACRAAAGSCAAAAVAVADSPAAEVAVGRASAPPTVEASSFAEALPKPQRRGISLRVPATFATAIGALRRNKMRSALTALGVIIGVGAVIAMMEIGQGSKAALQKTIASMGANTLMIHSGAAASGGVTFGAGSVMTLTPQDAEEIARQCPAVSDVAPVVRARAQIVYGQPQLGAHAHLRHHARRIWRCAIGRT